MNRRGGEDNRCTSRSGPETLEAKQVRDTQLPARAGVERRDRGRQLPVPPRMSLRRPFRAPDITELRTAAVECAPEALPYTRAVPRARRSIGSVGRSPRTRPSTTCRALTASDVPCSPARRWDIRSGIPTRASARRRIPPDGEQRAITSSRSRIVHVTIQRLRISLSHRPTPFRTAKPRWCRRPRVTTCDA